MAVLALFFSIDRSEAVLLQGSSSTAIYLQEVRSESDPTQFEGRTRLYERLQFRVTDLAGPSLSFHAALTARNEASRESLSDTKTRLYRGYLQYRVTPAGLGGARIDARLGRQWVAAGVGTGTIDGLLIQTDKSGWGGLTLFGGTLGIDARDQWRLDMPEDSKRLGAEIRLRPRLRTGFEPELSASYVATQREEIDESRRIGARGSLRVRRQLTLWTEIRHDDLLDETYGQAAGAEFLGRVRDLRVWTEFNRRTPALPAESYFRRFETKPVSELRGGIGLRVVGEYRVAFDFSRIDFKEEATFVEIDTVQVSRSSVDRSSTVRLVLRRGWLEIGGALSSGFGGDRSRLVIAADHAFGPRWSVRADLGFERYDYGPFPSEEDGAASGILAIAYKAFDQTRITAQIEGLNNRDLRQDVRLLARVDQGFRFGRGPGGRGR